jgi:hypothetical protein
VLSVWERLITHQALAEARAATAAVTARGSNHPWRLQHGSAAGPDCRQPSTHLITALAMCRGRTCSARSRSSSMSSSTEGGRRPRRTATPRCDNSRQRQGAHRRAAKAVHLSCWHHGMHCVRRQQQRQHTPGVDTHSVLRSLRDPPRCCAGDAAAAATPAAATTTPYSL